MLQGIVGAALKQRLVVVVLGAVLIGFGLHAARKLSVDAFPDVTNVQVQIATEVSGRSARGSGALRHGAGRDRHDGVTRCDGDALSQ